MIPSPSRGYHVTWNADGFNTQFPKHDAQSVTDENASDTPIRTSGRIIRIVPLDGASNVKVTLVPGNDTGEIMPKLGAISAGDQPIELGIRFTTGFAYSAEAATGAEQVAIVYEIHER